MIFTLSTDTFSSDTHRTVVILCVLQLAAAACASADDCSNCFTTSSARAPTSPNISSLSLLLLRAVRGPERGWTAALGASGLADRRGLRARRMRFIRSFVPSRTASPGTRCWIPPARRSSAQCGGMAGDAAREFARRRRRVRPRVRKVRAISRESPAVTDFRRMRRRGNEKGPRLWKRAFVSAG